MPTVHDQDPEDLQLDLYVEAPVGSYLGAEQADQNAEPTWRDHALLVIREFAASGNEWTADDLRARVGEPDHPNRLGAVILTARKAGIIEPTGVVRPSTTASRHASLVRVWRGVAA